MTASNYFQVEVVFEATRKAKENDSTRFCTGLAWRILAERERGFERILEMIPWVRKMGMEVCTTLGTLSAEQASMIKRREYIS
jgi:biotin synthase